MLNLDKNHQKMHFQRFEFKYLVPRDRVEGIIPVFLNYMDIDDFAKNSQENSYIVASLYFDSYTYMSYYEKLAGVRSRKKLRLRYYNSLRESDIFLEIKRKHDMVIVKDRVRLSHDAAKNLIEGGEKPASSLSEFENKIFDEFLFTKNYYSMVPQNMVYYRRMPFYSKINPRFRVTIDYDIRTFPAESIFDVRKSEKVYPDFAVLEVKYDGTLPEWFQKIIQRYSLERTAFSKYCNSLEVCAPELAETHSIEKYNHFLHA